MHDGNGAFARSGFVRIIGRYTPFMGRLLDAAYILALTLAAPIWLPRMLMTGKHRTDWAGRFGRTGPLQSSSQPRILVHGVSVGEINAARLLVNQLAQTLNPTVTGKPTDDRSNLIISATTNTGIARASTLFEPRHPVVRFPFDLSSAIRRFLDAVRPDLVVLMELEVWPNFMEACAARGIPVCVVNGRLTERSLRRYRWVRPIIQPTFARLTFAAVQTREYADRFARLGLSRDRVHVTGTMKWDTAEILDTVPGANQLAVDLGIDRARPLIVAGSTAPQEHRLLHEATPPGVQLLCAPRKPEWFDQAAAALPGCARRSRGERGSATGRFLLDTIGELRQAYALADVVVVGRTFQPLHGSDMIDPVALGKAVVIGPSVENFQNVAEALRTGGGLVQCSAAQLSHMIADLLADESVRLTLARRGREVIAAHQGATRRHLELITGLLPQSSSPSQAFPTPAMIS